MRVLSILKQDYFYTTETEQSLTHAFVSKYYWSPFFPHVSGFYHLIMLF